MKPAKYILALFMTVLLSGCMSYIRDITIQTIVDDPVYERFYIHDNPKVGDKAIYTSDHRDLEGMGYTVTLKQIIDGLNVVSIEPRNKTFAVWEQLYWVTNDGWVKKAELHAYDKVYPLTIKSAGSPTIPSATFEQLATPQKLTINNKTYTVKYVQTREAMRNIESDPLMVMGAMRSDIVFVEFFDPSVPFGIVKTMMSGSSQMDANMLDYIQVLKKATSPQVFAKDDMLEKLYNTTLSIYRTDVLTVIKNETDLSNNSDILDMLYKEAGVLDEVNTLRDFRNQTKTEHVDWAYDFYYTPSGNLNK